MRQLHIRAQSGPRPVTAAAVRALVVDGSLDPTSPVLSLDAGRSWQAVETALAVIDGLAVDDTSVDRALRVGPLHPIAMPLGAVGLVLLAAGIGFGGGPAAPVIRETPAVAVAIAAATVEAGTSVVQAGLASGGQCVDAVASVLMQAGMARVAMPASTAEATTTPASTPATATTGLLADWRSQLANRDQAAEAWATAAEALGKRTVTDGVAGWDAKLAMLETLTDENRARYTASFPDASKAIRLAMFDVDAGKDVERIAVLLLVEDKALAATCDSLAAAGRDLRITAQISKVSPDPAKHAVMFQGTLSAVE